jgi:hypothetical protein
MMQLVPHKTLWWLNSIDPNKVGDRAVRVKEHEESMYRYCQFWKRYLCYCVMEDRLGREEAGRRYGIWLDDGLWEHLKRLEDRLDVAVGEERSRRNRRQRYYYYYH